MAHKDASASCKLVDETPVFPSELSSPFQSSMKWTGSHHRPSSFQPSKHSGLVPRVIIIETYLVYICLNFTELFPFVFNCVLHFLSRLTIIQNNHLIKPFNHLARSPFSSVCLHLGNWLELSWCSMMNRLFPVVSTRCEWMLCIKLRFAPNWGICGKTLFFNG